MKLLTPLYFVALVLLCRIGNGAPPAASETFETLNEAATNPDFLIQGEYLTPETNQQRKGLQVVALGHSLFRVVLYNGGLPGAGWDRKLPQVLDEEETADVQDLIESLHAQKISRKSPTFGEEPPPGAIVLFDGTQESLKANWKPGAKINAEGFLSSGATTIRSFRDQSVHLEFRTPFMPDARGQARGNSGVYFQSRYETQILDSFGLRGLNNETGGIYTVRQPDLNMCLPPLSWQTYDVDFTSARFDDQGKKLASARMTVRLNGVIVQRDVEVPSQTRASPLKESPAPAPLYLQDHGNPVSYRNIWVVERDADLEARRPRLPSYERFLALSDRKDEGGLLLLGELGCLQCHAAGESLKAEVLTKQAPILTDVGNRVQPEWMMKFISDPHGTKPGTTMPDLFSGWNTEKREAAVLALTNFLTHQGKLQKRSVSPRFVAEGEKLFHSVGCVACHAPQNGTKAPLSTSVPLPELEKKYTIPSLASFLKNPHAVRPSGRMPSLNLKKDEPDQIAHYLLRQGTVKLPDNVHFKVYEGNWDRLPDFDEMQPVAEGTCVGFDLSKSGRKDHFGMRFEGYLPRPSSLTGIFELGSDDGARLTIEGQTILETDGIHPFQAKKKTARLDNLKVFKVQVDYFEAGGGEELLVELSTSGKPADDLGLLLRLTEKKQVVKQKVTKPEENRRFRKDPALVARGRELFQSLGCANCHEFKEQGRPLASKLKAKPFAQLSPQEGCLAETISSKSQRPIPDYDLVAGQRHVLELAALSDAESQTIPTQPMIERTLMAFNCYACHQRQGLGGPEASRNMLFQTTQHEMGDEGRIPPLLDGVGDKLQESWLKTVLDQGANNRPYMLTRMPKFGGKNVGHLVTEFVALDRREEAQLAKIDEPLHRVKATGRQLVGNGGLACIKCHTFGAHQATGIQAISLTGMTSRIRSDWFLRYLFDPAQYRPGTRMPTGFPKGQAVIRDLYDGDPNRQLTAIWTYLSDGERAGLPAGLVASIIELKPESEPILFRNFFEGVSPRGIAVGYPERAHLFWDLNELCLRQVWHDRFIDASVLWSGRGKGKQRPLGDHILTLEPIVPFARLETVKSEWPTKSLRHVSGYQCQGYQLNDQGQPTFHYTTPFGAVSDFPEPVAVNDHEGTFRRRFSIRVNQHQTDLYFRGAIGKEIEPVKKGFRVNDAYTIRIIGGGKPVIRTSAGQQELLIPLSIKADGTCSLVQEILW